MIYDFFLTAWCEMMCKVNLFFCLQNLRIARNHHPPFRLVSQAPPPFAALVLPHLCTLVFNSE